MSAESATGTDVVTASEIGDYLYCQRAWWYAHDAAPILANAALQRGTDAHRRIGHHLRNSAGHGARGSAPAMIATILLAVAALLVVLGALWILVGRWERRRAGIPGGQVVYRDLAEQDGTMLRARTLPLHGRPDLLLRHGHAVVPVEVKPGHTPAQPHESHVLQLLAYCLLVAEDYGTRPPHGVLRYPAREFVIPYTPDAEAQLRRLVREICAAKHAQQELARSHTNPRRCAACGFRDRCNQVLLAARDAKPRHVRGPCIRRHAQRGGDAWDAHR